MPIRETATPRSIPCPHGGCPYRASNQSGLTRHVQALHPDRLHALVGPRPRPSYMKGIRQTPPVCVHSFPLGGDVRRWSPEHQRYLWIHVQTCRWCLAEREVRFAADCTPETCTTARKRRAVVSA